MSLEDLEINYEIPLLTKDYYIKFQSIIEFPELDDNINILLNNGELEHIFKEKSSYFEIFLKKDNKYKLNLKCNLFSEFTSKTLILIYFEENEKNYKNLMYNNETIIYKSIFSNDKIYFIDNINLIDGYNSYIFNLKEKSEKTNLQNLKINIYIKKYSTYDIDYIKNNTTSSDKEYDEFYLFEKSNTITIKTLSDQTQLDKTKLIYIDINYQYQLNPLYEYSIQKIFEKKNLEFKSYLVNWYTKYDFSPLKVNYKDTIFISTNHSNTIYPIITQNTRTFTSFYKGCLFVSYPEMKEELNQVWIKYSDERAVKADENDMGYFEVYKFDNKYSNSFEVIKINNEIENIGFISELKSGNDKYYYIKINSKNNNEYYLFNEFIEKYSYLNIKEMPINIIGFSQNKTSDGFIKYNNKNEYIFKIGNLRPLYTLLKVYLVKNENSNSLYISEGKIKIFTFPKNKTRISLDIHLFSNNLTNKNYINVQLLDTIKNNLYIEYNDEKYLLNNSGINLFYVNDYLIFFDIINNNIINYNIPVLIKFPLNNDKLKVINNKYSFEFNCGQIGIYKFDKEKNIKMKLKSDKNNFNIYYYIDYLSEDYLNNKYDLIFSPENYNKNEYTSDTINFEMKTDLEHEIIKIEESNANYTLKEPITYNLYLIFSFNEKVIINYEDEKEDKNRERIYIIIIVIPIIVFIIITLLIIYYFFIYKKKKKDKIVYSFDEPEIQENEETPFNSKITSGEDYNYEKYNEKSTENNYPEKNEFKTIGNDKEDVCIINNSNEISIDNSRNFPAPLPA